ncbi:hypothetical protein Tco_0461595 [Tanacetum coccineum]
MMQSFCEKLLQQKQAASIDKSPLHKNEYPISMEDLKQHYLDEMLSLSNDLQIKDYRNEKIDIRFRRECESMNDELKDWKPPIFYDDDDDDDEKSSIPLRDIISELPIRLCLSTLFLDANEDECFDLGGEINRDDAFFVMDISYDIAGRVSRFWRET